MGLIEIEIERQRSQDLVLLLARASQIKGPTLEILGKDRLIRSFVSTSMDLGATAPPEFKLKERMPEVVAARAAVTIGHASIAELEVSADAETKTTATAWILVSFGPDPRKGPLSLILELIRIDVPGRPTTERFDEPPIGTEEGYKTSSGWGGWGVHQPLGALPIPVPPTIKVAGTALRLSDRLLTFRLATTKGEKLLAAPADRLVELNKMIDEKRHWLFRVSGGYYTDLLYEQLQKAIVKLLEHDAELEDPLSVAWEKTGIATPGGYFDTGWGATGSFRFRKRNACKGIFGNPSISVTVKTVLLQIPDASSGKLTTRLLINVGYSDWETFRCWAAKGGPLAGLGFLVGAPLAALGVGIGSLAYVRSEVSGEVGKGVKEVEVDDFKGVDSGNNYVLYEMTTDLPGLPSPAVTLDAATGPDGLVVSGALTVTAAAYHEPVFMPNPNTPLEGGWETGFNCQQEHWVARYVLQPIHITDPVFVLGGMKVPGISDREVAVFHTSIAIPHNHWKIDFPDTKVDQYVSIVGDAQSATLHVNAGGSVVPGFPYDFRPSGHVFLHTSAGLRRYDIAAVIDPPRPPTGGALAEMVVNCKNLGPRFVHPKVQARWLVDPPPFDYGHKPLRQWLLTISEVPAGARIEVYGFRDGERTGRFAYLTAHQTAPVAIEVVTDAWTELLIEHNLDTPPEGATLIQRWLLPTNVAKIGGHTAELSRIGDRVEARAAKTIVALSSDIGGHGAAHTAEAPPFSLTLPDGRVAAVHGSQLVIAFPFGGAAVLAPQRQR